MKRVKRVVVMLGLLAALPWAGAARAALVDRGGGLIYDTVLDITWLQNANLAGTTFTWSDAVAWASSLVYGGFDDWRLPYISKAAGAGPFAGLPVYCQSATEVACRDNELGYMYYWNLTPIGDPPPTNLGTNLMGSQGPFTGISSIFWSATAVDATEAWNFSFAFGGQGPAAKAAFVRAAWAVREGDTIPEPGSLALLGTGLVGLGGLRWLRRHRQLMRFSLPGTLPAHRHEMLRTRLAWATFVAVVVLASGADAASITFTDFSGLAGLQFNGESSGIHTCDVGGNTGCDPITDSLGRQVLRLTNGFSEKGTAFTLSGFAINPTTSFSSAFRFRISDLPPNPYGNGLLDDPGDPGAAFRGADGMVFAVETIPTFLGGHGPGLGYSSAPRPSVGVEFDTYNNGAFDGGNGNHVGINLSGNVTSVVRANVPISNPGTGAAFGRLNDGADWYAWVDYDGSTDLLEVRLSNTATRPTSAYLSHTVNLQALLDPSNSGSVTAFVGFTAGTGADGNHHDIVSWQFTDSLQSVSVPAPGTLELLGLVLLGRHVLRRRT